MDRSSKKLKTNIGSDNCDNCLVVFHRSNVTSSVPILCKNGGTKTQTLTYGGNNSEDSMGWVRSIRYN